MENWHCNIAVGLEPVLLKELSDLGFQPKLDVGGVTVQMPIAVMQEISPFLRTPTSIRLQLIQNQEINKLSDLRTALDSIPWFDFFPKGSVPLIKASCKRSKLQRSDIIKDKSNRILRAILQSKSGPILPIVIRIYQNRLWVSIQVHDDLLHKRGWRMHQVKTPLRENWAAALLKMANWQPDEALMDPFCGSGTILIEAARLAQSQSCHLNDPFLWSEWAMEHRTSTQPDLTQSTKLFGSDRDAKSVDKAKHNSVLAESESLISFQTCEIREIKAPCEQGLIITNPPYGISSGKKTNAVYHWFGNVLRQEFPLWRVLFLSPSDRKASLVSKNAQRITSFSNGGIPIGVYGIQPES